MKIKMSALAKTWILDLDGTIVKHNGYQSDGEDSLLEGAMEFFEQIKKEDMVIFLTSRKLEYKKMTEDYLKKMGIRFDMIIYEAPYGERILINDRKPSGLDMAYGFNTDRNVSPDIFIQRNERL